MCIFCGSGLAVALLGRYWEDLGRVKAGVLDFLARGRKEENADHPTSMKLCLLLAKLN